MINPLLAEAWKKREQVLKKSSAIATNSTELYAKAEKLLKEAEALYRRDGIDDAARLLRRANSRKLNAESRIIRSQAEKLNAESKIMVADADIEWLQLVIETHGNVELIMSDTECRLQTEEVYTS